jgi:hypothetical protein
MNFTSSVLNKLNIQIQLLCDGILKYCACRCLGVDSVKEYTHYIGIIPLEDPNYSQFAKEKYDIL